MVYVADAAPPIVNEIRLDEVTAFFRNTSTLVSLRVTVNTSPAVKAVDPRVRVPWLFKFKPPLVTAVQPAETACAEDGAKIAVSAIAANTARTLQE